MDWIKEHWASVVSFLGWTATTLVGVVMWVGGVKESLKVLETKFSAHAESDVEQFNGVKEHIDDKFKTMEARFDRIEDKLDGLFIPRSTRG